MVKRMYGECRMPESYGRWINERMDSDFLQDRKSNPYGKAKRPQKSPERKRMIQEELKTFRERSGRDTR